MEEDKTTQIQYLKHLKRGTITGMEFIYANMPDDLRQSFLNIRESDGISIFSAVLKWFLTDSETVLNLIKIAAEENKDAQGLLYEIKDELLREISILKDNILELKARER